MDSKKLAAFLTVAQVGNLTRAAQKMNYTQSGMTHMMNALEKELGVALLRRGRSGVSLTPEATYLLPKIETLVSAAKELESALGAMNGSAVDRIRVGAYPSMAEHWLPEILRCFRQEIPGAAVELRTLPGTENYAMLRAGDLDCAFVSYQPEELGDGLEWIPLYNDELVAVLPEEYPVRGALFSVSDFEGQEFVMSVNGLDRDIRPVFTRSRVTPLLHTTELEVPTILSMVERGQGLSILSELIMRGQRNHVQVMPLTPPAYRELGIARPVVRERRELLDLFVNDAKLTVMTLFRAGTSLH